ncbi:MAG: hypothetical protein O2783_08170 [Chloroflexi bacterium]|nr:hypothetical protein [Chloroflexota bacterium]
MTSRILAKWVEAWPGGGSHIAGWQTCNLVETWTQSSTEWMQVLSVERSEARYCHEEPELEGMHRIYLIAQDELLRGGDDKSNQESTKAATQ